MPQPVVVESASLSVPRPSRHRFRSALGLVGPGIISGAANDDPTAIGTYAKAGASFGFALLWMLPATFPMMAATVYLCSKLGMVTGKGIAGVIRSHYSRWLLYPIVATLVVANVLEAGADISAIASALRLILPIPVLGITVGITVLVLLVQAYGSYDLIQKIFRWLALALFSYVAAAFLAHPNFAEVFKHTLRPTIQFHSGYLAMMVAIIGTTLSPYLFFWQAGLEIEETKAFAIAHSHSGPHTGASNHELRSAALDVSIGMLFSTVVSYFIVLGTAATLFKAGHTNIETAAEAAQALRPLAGNAATWLFATGVIGVGILAVPVLTTGAAYALAETFEWKTGLNHTPEHAKEFYAVIALATCVAIAIGLSGINPINALFWAGLIMGLLAPPIMFVIMLITNNREVMGRQVNGVGVNILGWGTTAAISAASVGLLWSWIVS
jgi:NRAMP (natural resistance-associated macrophage protein)-like metal ion transporter